MTPEEFKAWLEGYSNHIAEEQEAWVKRARWLNERARVQAETQRRLKAWAKERGEQA